MKYGFMPIVQFHANSHTRDQALTPPPPTEFFFPVGIA